ncbi:DUF3592 domain-containing protein [Porcipelethomonas sp.]|uniref:DUF3592 domain-containing protein n=1 Tax=Porcipelethomonas sp. TaxID=2981675 RepID=UPI003EF4010E
MKIKSVKKIFIILGILFFTIGIIFVIIGGVVLARNISFMSSAKKTNAEIISINADSYRKDNRDYTSYDVWIEYTVDGDILEEKLNEYNSYMYEGKEIEVYYDPDNPSDVRMESNVFEFIFLVIGGIFAVIGAVFLIIVIVTGRRVENLKKSGDKLSGTITDVKRNYSIRINNCHPFKAECKVINPYDGETYLYSSQNITDDITGFIGMTVTVYVDRNNKRKYYVDIPELMEKYIADNDIHDYR